MKARINRRGTHQNGERVNERSFNVPLIHAFARSLIYSFTLSLVLLSCGSDNRQTARIPDFPKPGDSSRTEGALRALTVAINQSSPASAYAKRAVILLAMGRGDDALSDINEAIGRDDNAGTYYLTRARILRALQQPGKALENAQRAEILGVDTPELYTLQGDLLQQQGEFDKARLYVAKALQMAPYDGEAHFFNGLMAAKQGDTVGALALYHARLHYGRGLIYHRAGELDSAMACYQQTVKLQPTYYPAYFQTGLIHQKYRNYYPALTNYQRVQQLRPQFPRIATYLGYCYEQMGQYEQAVAAYTKAASQNAADRQAAAGLWRSQRRMSAQNSLFLPDTPAEPAVPARNRIVLDTTRVPILAIQPKSRVTESTGDSLRNAAGPTAPADRFGPRRTIKPIN